ncbi:MAG: hypothetical protein VKK97_03175 [Synechococcaceae cyanobacterium]|nr:hypothetical protein [Synechococcaceae cyanobacterium]
MDFDAKRIEASVNTSLGVIDIRRRIGAAEAELEKGYAALSDLPRSLRGELMERHEQRLESLLQREKELVAQARRTAEAELRRERLESLRIEAAPLLERVEKNLGFIRESLSKVAAIEREARGLGGRVMTEAFDKTTIDFFVPKLTYQRERSTWLLKR